MPRAIQFVGYNSNVDSALHQEVENADFSGLTSPAITIVVLRPNAHGTVR
jgi:hypothetical protein